MSAISGGIPNLIGGISQQPPDIRPLNTAAALKNTVSSTATGLQTRPGGSTVATIPIPRAGGTIAQHVINKGSGRFLVTATQNNITVTNLITGAQEPVFIQGSAAAYLADLDAQDSLGFVTVADTTFVFNRNRTVGVSNTGESGYTGIVEDGDTRRNPNLWSTVWMKQRAGYNAAYWVYLNNNLIANFSTDGHPPAHIAGQLQATVSAHPDTSSASMVSSTVFSVVLRNEADFVQVQDEFANQAMFAFNDYVDEFVDLPNFDQPGRLVLVKQDEGDPRDDYWVWYHQSSWQETYGWNANETLNAATMPHVLMDNGNGTWTIKPHTWPGRQVGDRDSNPSPAFVGRTINEMFIHKGRMCILTDENFVASEVANYENFYRSSCTQLLDTDRIDIAVPSGRGAEIRHARDFSNQLLLFTNLEQFAVTGDQQDIITPNSIDVKKVNSYNCSKDVTPTYIGPNVVFVDDFANSGWATVMEYQIDQVFGRQVALAVTDAVPELIPAGVYKVEASSSDDVMYLLTSGSPKSIWMYDYYFNNQGKVQSSWQEWKFAHNVYGAAWVNDVLYVTVEVEGTLTLMAHTFNTGADVRVSDDGILLDLRVGSSTLTKIFDGTNTTVTMPYQVGTDVSDYRLFVTGGTRARGTIRTPISGSGNDLVFSGDFTADVFYVGLSYEFCWRLNPIYSRDNQQVAIQDGRFQLRGVSFQFSDTGPFDVHITPPARPTTTSQFTGFRIGEGVIGSVNLDSGKYRVGARGRGEEVGIEVVARTPYRVAFSSLEWDGRHRPKRRRTT